MQERNTNLYMFITVLFCTCLIISNIAAFKLFKFGPIVLTSGVLLFPITYIINDLVAEVYGYSKAKHLIWTGFMMNILTVIYFKIAILLPAPEFFMGQEMFATVLGNTFRVVVASLSAYWCGSFLNAAIMSLLKVSYKGDQLFRRAVVSTLVGEAVDSVIFVTIAFYGTIPIEALVKLIITQVLAKTLYEIFAYPLTVKVVKKVKEIEGIDHYDYKVSYSPFNMKGE